LGPWSRKKITCQGEYTGTRGILKLFSYIYSQKFENKNEMENQSSQKKNLYKVKLEKKKKEKGKGDCGLFISS